MGRVEDERKIRQEEQRQETWEGNDKTDIDSKRRREGQRGRKRRAAEYSGRRAKQTRSVSEGSTEQTRWRRQPEHPATKTVGWPYVVDPVGAGHNGPGCSRH